MEECTEEILDGGGPMSATAVEIGSTTVKVIHRDIPTLNVGEPANIRRNDATVVEKSFDGHSVRRTKRPRLAPCETATGTTAQTSNKKSLPAPTETRALSTPARPPNSDKHCCFCSLPGSIRECEGVLLGPFHSPKGRKRMAECYAHRNCALWASEVHEAPDGNLINVFKAFERSKRQKCLLCSGKNPSLGCSHNGKQCCRPMHFRCALRGGALFGHNFEAFCPRHKEENITKKGLTPESGQQVDSTPVSEILLLPDKGCPKCEHDNYDMERGSILSCATCNTRIHSKCVPLHPILDCGFNYMSYKGGFYCKECMPCFSCSKAIDSSIYEQQNRQIGNLQGDPFDDTDLADECDTVLCVGCNHVAIHKRCVPFGVPKDRWRCGACFSCRHCELPHIPKAEWSEKYEACRSCFEDIQNGGVICPVCVRVYREYENVQMIQCDFCDKWIHSQRCAGLSEEKFDFYASNEKEKYRCPLCCKEKKRRDGERRKSRGRLPGNATGRPSESMLKAVLSQMPAHEEDIPFHLTRNADAADNEFNTAGLADLAIGSELCRHCCSGGNQDDLLFCAACGDCYHPYCIDAKVGKPPSVAEMQTSGTRFSYIGRIGSQARAWLCVRCDMLAVSSEEQKQESRAAEVGNGTGSRPEGLRMSAGTDCKDLSDSGARAPEEKRLPFQRYASAKRPRSSAISVGWDDLRKCDLCGCGESEDGTKGRLLPWASCTNMDVSDSWVHIACAMWSVGVSVHGSNDHCDTMLAPRRSLLTLAKKTHCVLCGKNGATLRCSASTCRNAYHFSCAREVGVACIVNFTNPKLNKALRDGTLSKYAPVNLCNLENVRILCPGHRILESKQVEGVPSISEIQLSLNTKRVIRILDRQGYSPDTEPPKKKPLSSDRDVSMRVGSLTVLRFGALIPEVNQFVIDNTLVPLGFCATRRFWSVRNAGKRCTYFYEVGGCAQSGPVFSIRCSDDPRLRVRNHNPDLAWSEILSMLRTLRTNSSMNDASFRLIRTSGLEAFGLQHCAPVVAHVESLPMAALFKGRYMSKRVVSLRNNDILFYNALARNYKPVSVKENPEGSARVAGYLHPREFERANEKEQVRLRTYENAKTGALFQLAIAREILSKRDVQIRLPEGRSIDGISEKHVNRENGRTRRASASVDDYASVVARTKKAKIKSPAKPRNIAPSSTQRTVVLRSPIHGWGVYATNDIPANELIIEYVGEVIRPSVSDLREHRYCQEGIGCYMFEIVPGKIVDATKRGNAARYINHSCNPNCHSKTITVDNTRVVAIYSKRRIQRGEELSYDYQFPFDDSDRVECLCGEEQCVGFMN